MKKAGQNRLKWIASLMIVTQLILLLFLVTWLDLQYKEQKLTLQEKLEFTYKAAYDNVLEANIVKRIDSFTLNIGDSLSRDVHYHTLLGNTIMITSDSAGKEHMDLKKADSLAATLKNGVAFLMKTFLKKVAENGDTNKFITYRDSSLVKHVFENKLQDQNIKVKIAWSGSGGNNLRIGTKDRAPWTIAYVSDYNPFLMKKIAPQIGFSLLLFLLCCFAFLLSYNTIRKQYRLNLQKNDFINNMSHELKTPVATAKVAVVALQKFDAINDPKRKRDYMEMAAWEIERLDRLVTSVMNNVQMENGTINMLKQTTDLNALLQHLADNMQPLFNEKHKMLTYQSPGTNVLINMDSVHMQGALYNILDNALKYGGGTVTIQLIRQADDITISVSDNGPGIPEVYKEKIFEKFFRVPSGNIHDVRGYGLGLNYVHYVIKAHGGIIRQQNNEDGGAKFVITLPAQP